MQSVWGLAQDVKFKSIESNLYVLKLYCLGDWGKVMGGGLWNFCTLLVCIEPYDGFSKPSSINMDTIHVLIRIHDLHEAYKPLVANISRRVGKYEAVEADSMDLFGNLCRVRVKIDIRGGSKPSCLDLTRREQGHIYSLLRVDYILV